MEKYDYIIIGAGASGLLLASAMAKDSFFDSKRILLLDKNAKKTNDRTWCYWEKGPGQFDALVSNEWKTVHFESKKLSQRTQIAPYTYKMIKGIDFYSHYLNEINLSSSITFLQEEVMDIEENHKLVTIRTKNNTYTSSYVFNSIFDYAMAKNQQHYPVLQQHFMGWVIQTKNPVFDPKEITYMDFSIPQKGNTRFMYVLPYSSQMALIEYTLFSEHLLDKPEYEEELKTYIKKRFQCHSYEITEKEFGSIPMTTYDFRENHTKRIRYIGTAGGWAKPSTGYTLMSTAKKIPLLIDHIKNNTPLKKLNLKNKFWYYDLLFLDVLYKDNANGYKVFESLFNKLKPQKVFKFLDEETNLIEDLNFIAACPKLPFIKAFFKRLF
ncbi:lycopene cyclase family protein [Maribacter sp. LLG6340-A2]|uniref:lycopene cyclase family protein n=1 Tax=Maribacter sp. LLG6340-A2 TaxID=3160834 RepID=UPI003866DB45